MISTTIQGIPCQVKVTHFERVKPSRRADSDIDFYGYTEIDFDIFDRKGYKANWLLSKMTDDDRERIEEEILEYMGEDDDY